VTPVNSSNQAEPTEPAGPGRHLEFVKFLADVSARFVALPPDRVDDEIRRTLKDVLQFFAVDRCNLIRIVPNEGEFRVTHNADVHGVLPYPVGTARPIALIPYFHKTIGGQRQLVSFARLEDLPAEAAADKRHLEQVGVRSGVYIPIVAVRSNDYTLGASSGSEGRNCPEDYIPWLRMLGEVFVNAIERSKAELALRERMDEIEKLKLQLEKENLYLREEIQTVQGFEKFVGTSETLQYVLFRVKQVASTDTTVLILGETGTGKGLVAHAIHQLSARKDRPMITVNCAALPGSLIESELFGREKGAFTGAQAKQVGRFEIADGGTIFLDEIGELPLELQAKLLRVLQEGEFERLGSPRTVRVDVRVLASTNRDLHADVRDGRFRQDLYYRVNVFPVSLPPLRQRTEDIPQLVRHFVDKHARKLGRKYESVPKSTMKLLQGHSWPGNVRELEHVIERAVITSPGPVLRLADRLEAGPDDAGEGPLKSLSDVERDHIAKVLERAHWRIEGEDGAASVLGLHPSTLRFRIKKLGITHP